MKISIDIIIPSFRLEENYVLPILILSKPEDVDVQFYLIVDNPAVQPPASVRSMVDDKNIFLFINPENIGASASRNKGIDAGKGDWILFLDDDIIVKNDLLYIYADAIRNHPNEIGFIGLITLPEPESDFTRAIQASGSMDIFGIARHKKSFAWGATANIMVKRSAMSSKRFSTAYPKSGGGEDVDFFLQVREHNNYKNFCCLPGAAVQHPWWNNKKVNLTRPFRYGKGNSLLGQFNPKYTYRDLLSTPETLLILCITLIIVSVAIPRLVKPTLIFIAGVFIIEIIASAIQTIKRFPRANLKVMMYVMLIRLAQETGVLWSKLGRLKIGAIGERFHDDGTINKIYFYRSNTYRIVKWILYPLLFLFIWQYF